MGSSRSLRLVLTGMVVALVAALLFAGGSGWSHQAVPSTEGTGPARFPIQTQKVAPDREESDPTETGTSQVAPPTQEPVRGTPSASPERVHATPFVEGTEESYATPFPEGTGPARFPTPTPTPEGTP
jgi:hypothetical protein